MCTNTKTCVSVHSTILQWEKGAVFLDRQSEFRFETKADRCGGLAITMATWITDFNRRETLLVWGKIVHQWTVSLCWFCLKLDRTSDCTRELIAMWGVGGEGCKRRWKLQWVLFFSSFLPLHRVSVSKKWGVCIGAMRKPPVAWQAYLYHLSLWH